MDKAVFIKKLKDIFITLSHKEKKYTEVWLSDIDYGGLYHSDKFKLNLKAGHQTESYKSEVSFIFELLDMSLDKEEVSHIYTLEIFHDNEFASPNRNDIILYNDELASQAA